MSQKAAMSRQVNISIFFHSQLNNITLNFLGTNGAVSENEEFNGASGSQTHCGNGKKRLGKKRFREPEKHKKFIRKKRRNAGQEYLSISGKKVAAKTFSNTNCGCKKKCFERIPEVDRQNVFELFWKMGEFSAQNAFICGLVKQNSIKRSRSRNATRNRKSASNEYFVNINNISQKVCKQYFLQTFQISNGRLERALQRARVSSPGEDLRGKHTPVNKTPEQQMQNVREHISSFPAYQSHYTRSHNPNRKYLDSSLNVRLMYNLYKENCSSDNISPVSEAIYRNIFHRDFNLHFHVPSKDTCVKCDLFKGKWECSTDIKEKNELKIQHDLHLAKAENARKCLANDRASAILNRGKVYAFTFDLEKALPFPTLTCSIAYYKRNMYVYNLGIHELAEKERAFMYVWDETTASRGAQEIGSCIRKHIVTKASTAEHIIAYSDACGGQNRNFKQCLFWLKLIADTNIEVIDHKFMVSGHSFLPNDRDFGQIEQYAKDRIKYVPEDWYSIIQKCRSKNPFALYKMNREDFFSIQVLENLVTRRNKNENNNQVSWLKIQWLHFERDKPYKIFYKETLNQDYPFEILNILPNRKGAPKYLKNIQLTTLYSDPLKISAKKKKDMQELYQFIPPCHQEYFKKITEDPNIEDNGPLNEDDVPLNEDE